MLISGPFRSKKELWTKIAEDIGIPWKNAEAMHWQIGKEELSARAGVAPFNLSRAPSIGSPPDHRYSISSSNGFMTESSAGSTPAYSPYAYSPSSPYEYQVVPGYPQPMFPATYGVPTAMPVSHAAPENVRAPVGGKEKQRRKQ